MSSSAPATLQNILSRQCSGQSDRRRRRTNRSRRHRRCPPCHSSLQDMQREFHDDTITTGYAVNAGRASSRARRPRDPCRCRAAASSCRVAPAFTRRRPDRARRDSAPRRRVRSQMESLSVRPAQAAARDRRCRLVEAIIHMMLHRRGGGLDRDAHSCGVAVRQWRSSGRSAPPVSVSKPRSYRLPCGICHDAGQASRPRFRLLRRRSSGSAFRRR
jgi:hypothetical protein